MQKIIDVISLLSIDNFIKIKKYVSLFSTNIIKTIRLKKYVQPSVNGDSPLKTYPKLLEIRKTGKKYNIIDFSFKYFYIIN